MNGYLVLYREVQTGKEGYHYLQSAASAQISVNIVKILENNIVILKVLKLIEDNEWR